MDDTWWMDCLSWFFRFVVGAAGDQGNKKPHRRIWQWGSVNARE
jgi:hypothetical protein